MMPSELHRIALTELADACEQYGMRLYAYRDENTRQTFTELYFGKSRIVLMIHDGDLANRHALIPQIKAAMQSIAMFHERECILMDGEK